MLEITLLLRILCPFPDPVFPYCMAAFLLHVGYTTRNGDRRTFPVTGLLILVTFLLLVSTSAWANALTDIKIATGHSIVQECAPCRAQGLICYFGFLTSMGSLNVSVISGFLNMILWGRKRGLCPRRPTYTVHPVLLLLRPKKIFHLLLEYN